MHTKIQQKKKHGKEACIDQFAGLNMRVELQLVMIIIYLLVFTLISTFGFKTHLFFISYGPVLLDNQTGLPVLLAVYNYITKDQVPKTIFKNCKGKNQMLKSKQKKKTIMEFVGKTS